MSCYYLPNSTKTALQNTVRRKTAAVSAVRTHAQAPLTRTLTLNALAASHIHRNSRRKEKRAWTRCAVCDTTPRVA